MPIQIRCQCGKQFRVVNNAGGKRLRCKACGEELVVPNQSTATRVSETDDEIDAFDLDSPRSVAHHFSGEQRLAPRAGRSSGVRSNTGAGDDESSSNGVFSLGDVVVRSSALCVFVLTLGNCAYQLLRADGGRGQGQGQTFDAFIWGITPLLVAGPFALYIAWIGEEPDPEACRANRLAGLVKCGIGLALVAIGAILTVVVSVFLAKLAGMSVAFTGLMFGGALMFAYGGLSVLTGREFTKTGLSHRSTSAGSQRKRKVGGSRVAAHDQPDESDLIDNEDDECVIQTERRVGSADRSSRRSRRRPISAPLANLIALLVVAGGICVVVTLALFLWPDAQWNPKPDVADAKPAQRAPKFVPPGLPAQPAQPAFPPPVKFPPVNQPAPEIAAGPSGDHAENPAAVPPQDSGGGTRRGGHPRGGFPRGGFAGPGRFRSGMPPAAPGFPPNSGGPAMSGRAELPITMTATIGGTTAAHSHTESSHQPMLGLWIESGDWEGTRAIKYLKPIFARDAADGRGEAVIARKGYVVGGLDVDADKVVHALRITFVRIDSDEKLIADDTYTSDWIGKPTGQGVRKIDADGQFVMGIVTGTPGMNIGPVINVGLALRKN